MGQFVNLSGQIIIFENFEGPICNSLEIYWGQFEKFEDQNIKFEKIIKMKNFEIISFYVLFQIL